MCGLQCCSEDRVEDFRCVFCLNKEQHAGGGESDPEGSSVA